MMNSFEKGEAEIEKELSEVISVIENTKADIINFDKEIEINKISISEYDAEVLKLETDMAEFENNLTKIRENLIESNLNLKSVIMEIEHQSERYDDIAVQRDNAENVNKEREAEIEENIKNLEDIKKEIAELEYTKVKLFENNELNSKRIAELTEKKKDVNDKIRLMQEENKETRDKFYTLKNYLTKLETKKNKIENDLDAYIDRLWQDYELTFSEAEKLSKNSEQDFNPAKAKRRIEELKNLIKGLGNINIDAIEGYKSVKERYDFLVVQTEDLKKSKVDLEKIIAELLAVMKKQFKEQFAVINKNFQTVFKELFGGGTAKLELSDPSDLLESGIEIEVQPPGKKLQRLSLLSGGERAFTAIALLFAILKVRPTPFCILDEIEAALDDVNVFRFAAYLKKYSEKTQFIVVTHRRGTMEAANILYGVTMQERGVSKLLSLNIDEVTE